MDEKTVNLTTKDIEWLLAALEVSEDEGSLSESIVDSLLYKLTVAQRKG